LIEEAATLTLSGWLAAAYYLPDLTEQCLPVLERLVWNPGPHL
jgi:hypothetical protein